MIQLTIEHRVEEHIRAERLYYSKRSKFFSIDKVVAVVLLVVGIVSTVTVGPRWWTLIWFVLAPLEFFNLLSIAPLVTRFRFQNEPRFKDPHVLTFDASGVHFTTRSIDSKLQWSLYDGVLEDDQLFLLTYGATMFSVIPKRCFPDEPSVRQFRELLRTSIQVEPVKA